MNRLPSIRRWGVAALTGVTLFGGLSLVGAGAASAATAPTVSAAVTSTATTIPGTATAQAGATLALSVTGTVAIGDQITLTLGCPTTGTASINTVTTTSAVFTAGVAVAQAGTTCSTETLTAGAAATNPVIDLTISYDTNGVTSQPLALTGTYSTLGLAATNFTVPTDASVVWFSIAANTPMVTLPSAGTTAVAPITINEPVNIPAADKVVSGDSFTLTLPAGDTWSGTPSLSAPGSTSTATIAGNVLTIAVTVAPVSGGLQWTVSNVSVVTTNPGSLVGSQDISVVLKAATVPVTPLVDVVAFTGVSVGTILGTTTTIYGANGTADGTVAAEFENAYPAATGGNANVVLATDAPHANGSDALAASYLEGTLGTGLLITSPTSLGTDARQAMQLEGVKTVYVVGGPLAISPAVIAEIQALPAYNAGGLTTTGNTVQVVGPIYGADGTAEGTAAAIATRYGAAYGAASFAGAYSASGGLYNATTGNASTVAPVGTLPTAIVVASSDWQDAMSIAPEAFNKRFPVILNGPSTDTTLSADAQGALTTLGVKQVIVIGGQLALQNSVATQIEALNGGISVLRVAGIDATDTAAQIAQFALAATGTGLGWNLTDTKNAVLASHGDYWTDALGAAALGGGANAATFGTQPLILVQSPTVVGQYTTAVLPVLGGLGITNLTVLGGPLAMPSSTVQTLLAGL